MSLYGERYGSDIINAIDGKSSVGLYTRGVWDLGLSVCHIFFMAGRNNV
ncbi:MAG: hypothetical protein GXP08_14360 [Gammaproteobacteria bacterium]|nr:hypothetical protein [Gammaproteobacteria bacterium]